MQAHSDAPDTRPIRHMVAQLAQASTPNDRSAFLDALAACSDGGAVREALRYRFASAPPALAAHAERLRQGWSRQAVDALMHDLELLSQRLLTTGRDTLVMINHTFAGGGVAEMLQTQGDILHALGLRVEWFTTRAADADYTETGRRVSDALQGADPDISEDALQGWSRENMRLAKILRHVARDARVAGIFLEDHHPIHLIEHFKALRPDVRLIWRCHDDYEGIVQHCPGAVRIWQGTMRTQLARLGPGDVALFQPGSIPPDAIDLPCAALTEAPGINLLAPKNVPLEQDALPDLLRRVAPGLDIARPTLVTGGRYVAWKGMLPLLRAFCGVAEDVRDIDLLMFGTVSQGDPRKVGYVRMIEHQVKTMRQQCGHIGQRLHVVKDQHDGIRAFYALAARHRLPFLEWSLREGYGLMADEATRQGAVPSTTWQGGLRRYREMPVLRPFGLDVADLVNALPEPYEMYGYAADGAGLVPKTDAVVRLEQAFASKLRQLLSQWRKDPAWSRNYAAAAAAAHRMTLQNSLVTMSRDYLACCVADADILQQARHRIRGQEMLAPAARIMEVLA